MSLSEEQQSKDFSIPKCSMNFAEITPSNDSKWFQFTIDSNKNMFAVHHILGIVIVFLAPTTDENYWKCYAISISHKHGAYGNSRVYITYSELIEHEKYDMAEAKLGLMNEYLMLPVQQTLIVPLCRLQHAVIETRKRYNHTHKEINKTNFLILFFFCANAAFIKFMLVFLFHVKKAEPEKKDNDIDDPQQCVGNRPNMPLKYGKMVSNHGLRCRVFTLEESLNVGSVIDVRDFSGKWYQGEIIRVADDKHREYIHYGMGMCVRVYIFKVT